ncbi:MAG: nucleoside triphosphate pyrophosphohydrolase [Chloroflexi bacterium]|nr:nucleoside triphosphate pyrophosphohydrolase [Chloroflexota bacterium]
MRVSVVGLGPGPPDWITPAARSRLRLPGARVFLRTRLFPGIEALLDGVAWESFDGVYASAESLDEVNASIVERLLSAGGEVVLGVPGDGVIGEAVTSRLLAAGSAVEVVPGVPLGVGALAAAGLAASDGAQVVEATSIGGSGIDLLIELNPRWPAVVTGVYSPRVASDLKLSLLGVYPADHGLRVVRHPGLEDAATDGRSLAELDRGGLAFDHLTHVVLPPVVGYTPTGSSHQLRAIVARLRAPEIGCPWDLEQTHRSLIPYAIEEAYEVVDAIESEDVGGLADELGDLLLQVALHAEIADQSDEFEWNDVVRGLSEKLVRRHPHVFGEVQVSGASEVVRNWDQLKAAERTHLPRPTSALDGVATSLPQLKRAAELAKRASKSGFDWPTRAGTLGKVREELDELLAVQSLDEQREELGDLLYVLAKLASQDGIDPEEALRAANRKFTLRFAALEAIARERGWQTLHDQPLAALEAAWAEAKVRVAMKSRGGET